MEGLRLWRSPRSVQPLAVYSVRGLIRRTPVEAVTVGFGCVTFYGTTGLPPSLPLLVVSDSAGEESPVWISSYEYLQEGYSSSPPYPSTPLF